MPALQAFGGVHGDGADGVLTDVLLALHDERGLTFLVHLEGFQDLGEGHAGGETDVHTTGPMTCWMEPTFWLIAAKIDACIAGSNRP